ncbi:hypothetical protein Cenrod_0514 [Candidatus Symbiobacter mobilis CR]|uniref:Uncharacterized protein n=1 Tax=Candidatus Symbiobacter mobilis CR TaxID=946483 RepID=U5N8N7_9BURK|nr:hypothetical protein Cenrod_0514 [Candidatus Symbiobacter mobilis CR]
MAEFEAVGCNVTPYLVDFQTGDATPWTEYSLVHSLTNSPAPACRQGLGALGALRGSHPVRNRSPIGTMWLNPPTEHRTYPPNPPRTLPRRPCGVPAVRRRKPPPLSHVRNRIVDMCGLAGTFAYSNQAAHGCIRGLTASISSGSK